jgi:hypothetical protein
MPKYIFQIKENRLKIENIKAKCDECYCKLTEVMRSFATSVLIRTIWHYVPEDGKNEVISPACLYNEE